MVYVNDALVQCAMDFDYINQFRRKTRLVEEFYEAHVRADKGCVGADCIQV